MVIYEDYSGVVSTAAGVAGGIFAGLAIFFILFFVIMIAISLVMIIAQWKIFSKAGKPGWYAIIPFLNSWIYFEIAGFKGWLSLIPFANMIFMLLSSYKIALKFGKSNGFAICTVIFPMICLPILAFSKVTFDGNINNASEQVNNAPSDGTVNTNANVNPSVPTDVNTVVASTVPVSTNLNEGVGVNTNNVNMNSTIESNFNDGMSNVSEPVMVQPSVPQSNIGFGTEPVVNNVEPVINNVMNNNMGEVPNGSNTVINNGNVTPNLGNVETNNVPVTQNVDNNQNSSEIL